MGFFLVIFFHFQNHQIKDLILNKMDKDEMVSIRKETKIKYRDLLVDYPFQKEYSSTFKKKNYWNVSLICLL